MKENKITKEMLIKDPSLAPEEPTINVSLCKKLKLDPLNIKLAEDRLEKELVEF